MAYERTERIQYQSAIAENASAFLSAVYGWMCAGLAITAVTAWVIAGSPAIVRAMATSSALFWGLAFVQLAIVFAMSTRVQQLAASTAGVLFVLFAVANGATMSFVLLAYTGQSVATTFFVTAGMFGGLALYGTTTKRSFDGLGQFLFMGLLGVVLASVVGIFWQNSAFQFALSLVGVLVFSGLTAYDAQRLKMMALESEYRGSKTYAIVGALALYLDFANLFLFLLRFTGQRRDS